MAKLNKREIETIARRFSKKIQNASLQKLETVSKNIPAYKMMVKQYALEQKYAKLRNEAYDAFCESRDKLNANPKLKGYEWDSRYQGGAGNYKLELEYRSGTWVLQNEIEDEIVIQMVAKDNDIEAVEKAILKMYEV